jgi:hypothetical protein
MSDNDRERENCRPLDRDATLDEPFFCGLGTMWCTEGHGPLEWQKLSDGPSRELAQR